jgi:hypothetical protein
MPYKDPVRQRQYRRAWDETNRPERTEERLKMLEKRNAEKKARRLYQRWDFGAFTLPFVPEDMAVQRLRVRAGRLPGSGIPLAVRG